MMRGPNARAADASGWARFRMLPRRAQAASVLLLASAAAPPAVVLLSFAGDLGIAAVVCAHSNAIHAGSCLLAVAAVLAFEPPRSTSALAYARQLRARFLEVQSKFDAEHRRRPREGKENEDARVPSEP